MACAHVQSVQGNWVSGSTYDTAITCTAGNALVVAVLLVAGNTSNIVSSVGDGTNTYAEQEFDLLVDAGINWEIVTYVVTNVSGGSLTITTTLASSVVVACMTVVHEVSGANTTDAADTHSMREQAAPGTGTDAVAGTAITTTTDGAYVFSAALPHPGAAVYTAGTNFTLGQQSAGSLGASEYRIQSVAGSITPTFTADTDRAHIVAAVSLKAAGGGGVSTTIPWLPGQTLVQAPIRALLVPSGMTPSGTT